MIEIKKIRMRRLANLLTITRVMIGVPIILALEFKQGYIAWILLLIGALTDYLDGWFAKKADGGTPLGALMDPLADKIMIFAPFIWLNSIGVLPSWAIWLMLSRELLISGWRAEDKKGAPASKTAKTKTALQFISLLLMLWPESWGTQMIVDNIHYIGGYLFWLSLFMAIFSALKYVGFTQKSYH